MNRPVEQQPYICGWVTSGIICGMPIIGELFSVHLRDNHQVKGDNKTKVRCHWSTCGLVMNKESIVRHVAEMHLQYKFYCDECDAIFTRRHSLNSHVQKKH
ncbi:hypothetical protein SCLCIDRAFT_1115444 [Scleroderma citrinum Foug A]|uniref:C2H2-type domain-containing protein n=1 Tax=Scleroderma citrinum Foug A TaxID=1036808 RepID=A0A0C2ZZU4_9AGAM|nr:hypothetical protein SCLCIDRAFT_1115444 [Scleroderma citrinum Foug A]